MSEFTPGPWAINQEEGIHIYPEGGGLEICSLFNYWAEEQTANAHLIAAAPELYEALKLARFEIDLINHEGPSAPYNAVLKTIENAINKAEGK